MTRRPLKSRGALWAVLAAQRLARIPIRPNHISVVSVLFAVAAGLSLFCAQGRALPFLAAAAFIQLRLLCNLLDGMVAIEGGLQSKSGEIFNDLPDRLSDAVILILAGYAIPWPNWSPELGWSAAVMAILTAYVRILGAAVGLPQDFSGPMAKPHRMAVLTVACFAAAIEAAVSAPPRAIAIALFLIFAGSLATTIRRTARIVSRLESSSS